MLSELRRTRGWSQTELARRAGVSQPTVSLIESGRTNTSLRTIRRIAQALGVPEEIVLLEVARLRGDGG